MKLIKVGEDKFIIVEGGNILYSTHPIDYSEQILLSEVKELIGDSNKTEWEIVLVDDNFKLK